MNINASKTTPKLVWFCFYNFFIALYKENNIESEKAYKGSFNVRISPELHKKAIICATNKQINLNSFVKKTLKNAVAATL